VKQKEYNPFPNKSHCKEYADYRKHVVCEENRRKYVGINKNEKLIAKFKIDGCIITEGKRCDFLVLICEEKIAYFIELKGCDLAKAAGQLNRSINLLIKYLSDHKINARITLTRVNTHDLRNSEYMKLERKIKSLNGTVVRKGGVLKEDL
jgi:hypothetical protein